MKATTLPRTLLPALLLGIISGAGMTQDASTSRIDPQSLSRVPAILVAAREFDQQIPPERTARMPLE